MSWSRVGAWIRIVSPVARRLRNAMTPMPVTNMASVESMNGAPRMAPIPTACDASPVANRIAMIGIIVSGRAVPTAARTDPTAPSARLSLRPTHSIPFVNSSAPIRMITSARMRTTIANESLQCRLPAQG
jgi:hypothetical protein